LADRANGVVDLLDITEGYTSDNSYNFVARREWRISAGLRAQSDKQAIWKK